MEATVKLADVQPQDSSSLICNDVYSETEDRMKSAMERKHVQERVRPK